MTPQRIGILHPGEMGSYLAASARHNGHQVYWASEGRGDSTKARAAKLGLRDTQTVENVCAECSILISICPPHGAQGVANQVLASGFTGLYLDANAIAPQRAGQIDRALTAAGIAFVDGGIIGGPSWEPNRTRLYLSGPRATDIAECFSAGPLATRVLGSTIGSASAVKMCFAAYTKGTAALLCAVLATAESLGVREVLNQAWAEGEAGFAERASQRVCSLTPKAWRWVGEMEEIAATVSGEGIPGDFHTAAGSIFGRLARFKDAPTTPELEEVLSALLEPGQSRPNYGPG